MGGRGSSSGINRGGSAGVNIPQAKTIAEANALAVSLGLAKHADFTGLDVSVANDAIRSLAEHKADFPNLDTPEFVGVPKAGNKLLGLRVKQNPDTVAQCVYYKDSGKYAIFINPKIQMSKERLLSHVKERWSPEGTGTMKSYIDHEMGHYMDWRTNAYQDTRLRKLFRDYHHPGDATEQRMPDGSLVSTTKIARALSEYANESSHEFIAEGWSEYRNNPSPRPLARTIGNIVQELYDRRSK